MTQDTLSLIKERALSFTIPGYKGLVRDLRKYMDAYYNNEPIVSDADYDFLMCQCKEVEALHPDWITPDSPTQIVEIPAERTMGIKVKHDVLMLSINDVFTFDEVKDWYDTVKAKYPNARFSVEEKIDGLSMTLCYKRVDDTNRFQLYRAETRGNGYEGEDITTNAKFINGIKNVIILDSEYDSKDSDELHVRGEVYMMLSRFRKYNEAQIVAGKEPAANARNLAAGTLRAKDPKIVLERGLDFFAFNIQKGPSSLMKDHNFGLDAISRELPIVQTYEVEHYDGIVNAINVIEANRNSNNYDIDGAVIKLRDIDMRKDFTFGAKYAPGHIAYKYPEKPVDVVIKDIEVGVGRTGKLSFTAVIEDANTHLPAQLNGTSVDRVTLNNMDYIKEFKAGIGSVHKLIKSGAIIPKIVGTVKPADNIFEAPTVCPCCGGPITNTKGGVDLYCTNRSCKEMTLNKLDYFCGRNQMNIDGLSEQKLAYLVEHGYIDSRLYTIFELANNGFQNDVNRNDLQQAEGWGETSVNNLVEAINKARHTAFIPFLASLGIDGIGHGQAKLLKEAMTELIRTNEDVATYVKTEDDKFTGRNLIDALFYAKTIDYDFTSINGFGDVLAQNLMNWFDSVKTGTMDGVAFEELLANVIFDSPDDEFTLTVDATDVPFTGLTFVVTGSVTEFKNRAELIKWIESKGGKCAGSVSTKTSYLVNNDVTSTSGKNKKAQELGIKIISEQELFTMAIRKQSEGNDFDWHALNKPVQKIIDKAIAVKQNSPVGQ